jgi:hypothetical protein
VASIEILSLQVLHSVLGHLGLNVFSLDITVLAMVLYNINEITNIIGGWFGIQID